MAHTGPRGAQCLHAPRGPGIVCRCSEIRYPSMRLIFGLFRRPTRPAAYRPDPLTELARIAASLLIVLVVIAAVASHPRRNVFTSLEDLGLAVLPSLAALLLTY